MSKIKINLLIGFIFLLLAVQVFSYDNLKTHPQITDAAATVYNKQADKKLTKEQINWLKDGSIAEDTDPRYINHYYNPVNGQGLSGWDKYKGIPIPVNGSPAKLWAKYQASASGDYSISAVFRNYKDGDLKRAYQGIGHIMHLIQDMAVPAHTRNDSHAEGDPYEKWAKQYGLINLSKVDYIQTNNIDEIFDELAGYSNNNFVSKDTTININVDDYQKVEEKENGVKIKYLNNFYNGKKYKYCIVDNSSIIPIFKFNDDFSLNLDYWNMLYPKAVGCSAGAIDYFIKGFAEIDQTKAQEKKLSLWQKVGNAGDGIWNGVVKLSDTISYTLGDSFLAGRNTIADGWDKISGASGAAYDFSALALQSSGEVIADTADKSIKAGEKAYQKSKEETTKALNAAKQESGKVLSAVEKAGKETLAASKDLLITKIADATNTKVIESKKAEQQNANLKKAPSKKQTTQEIAESKNENDKLKMVAPQTTDKFFTDAAARDSGGGAGENSENGTTIKIIKYNLYDLASKSSDYTASTTIGVDLEIENGGKVGSYLLTLSQDEPQAAEINLKTKPENFTIAESDGEKNVYLWLNTNENKISGPASAKIFLDTFAPLTFFNPLDEFNCAGNILLSWQSIDNKENDSSSGGIAVYDAQYKNNEGEWNNLIINSPSAAVAFNIDGASDSFSFRSRARDKAGNIGEWSSEVKTKVAKAGADHIVISEFAARGPNGATDEFVELYNPTGQDLDLAGWQLQSRSASSTDKDWKNHCGSAGLPGGLIFAKGYYLLAAEDYSLPTIPDYRHTANWGFKDEGGHLRIVNNSGIEIDRVGYGNAVNPEGAVALSLAQGGSLERKAYATSTAEKMQAEHQFSGNGYDSQNNSFDFVARNTPDPQNHFSPKEPREPLAAEAVDDLIVSHPFTSSSSVTLYWTVPKNANAQSGARYDLRYQIKSGECALNSEWDNATAIASSILPVPGNEGEAQEAKISGLNKETEYCFAVKTFNGEAWSDISNHAEEKTLPIITGCTDMLTDMLVDEQGIIQTDKLLLSSSPYCSDIYQLTIAQGQSLTIEPGVVIKLKEESNITIRGELRAIGLPDQPIVFTSYYDNEKGGKVSEAEHIAARGDWGFIATGPGGKLFMENAIINYGGYTAFSPAMMRVFSTSGGVIYISDGSAEIKNCRIYDNIGGVDVLYNANVDISLSDIFNNQLGGILVNSKNSTVNIEQSKIHNNSGEGIRIIYTSNSEISVLNSEINNNHFGIINDSYTNESITAINNWWGDNSGPYHETLNPHGQGNAVGGAVLFDPWIGKE